MKKKNKIRIYPLIVFMVLLLTVGFCKKKCEEGTISVSASPNPVTAVYTGEVAKWTFDVTFVNNTCQTVTLGPVTTKVYDSDTGFTQQDVNSNWGGSGVEFDDGESSTFEWSQSGTAIHSGKYDLTMTATGDDGQEYEGKVTLLFQ